MWEVDELLLELQKEAGCMYLSDLPLLYRSNSWKLGCALKKVLQSPYSLQDWSKAMSYIMQKNCRFAASQELMDVVNKL